jgi:hypothetical protein
MSRWLEDAWLERYLDRQLVAGEIEWFEAYLLDKPHLLDRVEADTLMGSKPELRGGLDLCEDRANSPETGRSAVASVPTETGQTKPLPLRRRPALALAASLALGLGMGALLIATLRDGAPAAVFGPPRIVFDSTRDVSAAPVVHPGRDDATMILVEFALPADATAIEIRFDSGSSGSATPSLDGYVTTLVPRAVMANSRSVSVSFTTQGQRAAQTFQLPVEYASHREP